MIPTPQLPPPLGPGSRIGVAALSGPVDPARLRRGIRALEALGFEVVPAVNLDSRWSLFAGTDEERLEAFHRLVADPSIDAVIFARGGHGVLRLLPRLDWELIARRPRAFVGYSDLTPFLLQVVSKLGWVAFHGPMVAADLARGLTPEEETSFLSALAGRYPQRLAVSGATREGVAEGPLLGGCLSLLVALQGTEYSPDFAGSVLFWEEIHEPLFRLDRMLTHLRLSGSLQSIAGMLIGHIDWGRSDREDPVDAWQRLASTSLREAAPRIGDAETWPILDHFPAGHRAPNLTLPLGLWARIEAPSTSHGGPSGALRDGSSQETSPAAGWLTLEDRFPTS
ncbi:MAG: LD-carboxypeptidase [Acidobacteriota bacterium]